MRRLTLRIVTLLATATVACAGAEAPDSNDWVGTTTTEDGVTTVVNQSGSVWGGEGTLVEAASIGVENGADEFMFGRLRSVGATGDRIYLLDTQVSLVRVYNHDGEHLFDFGGPGQGPGEFDRGVVMGIDPAGRVIVQSLERVNVYDLDGTPVTTWPIPGGLVRPIVVTPDGVVLPAPRTGDMVLVAADGTVGEPLEVSRRRPRSQGGPDWELMATAGGRTRYGSVPFAPRRAWEVLPSGATVEGTSDAYRFTVRRPDGATMTIERAIDRAPVAAAEGDWHTRSETASMRTLDPGWVWDGDPVPESRPAFDRFHGDPAGRIWVLRDLGGEPVDECTTDPMPENLATLEPCWRSVYGYDVFDEPSGRFLGQVTLPAGVSRFVPPAFLPDGVVAIFTDEAGTIMVKRYRLELPAQ